MAEADGRVALVSGADKGIGFEMAHQLGQQGILVLIGARNQAKADEAAAKLKSEGIDAQAIVLDVTDNNSIHAAVQKIEAEFGKLDILINNAGVMLEGGWVGNSTSTTDPDILHKTFQTNFFAVIAVTQAFLPLLRKSPAARIVNMSSIQGSLTLQSDPTSQLYESKKPFAYNATKTAVNVFTVHLAHELRETPIKINSAHPGWVQTELGGEQATMSVEDGAKTGVELALLGADGPSGGYFHLGKPLPW